MAFSPWAVNHLLLPGKAAGERKRQGSLLIDIFGNPFRPLPPLPPPLLAWGGGLVPRLARSAYEEHSLPAGHLDNARLAVLADALEDDGCTEAKLLGHLRRPGLHWRGCWTLDRIFGKT